MAFAAHSKRITLSLQLPGGPLPSDGDAGHTHQILTNYISNALKYSPPETRTTISVRAKDRYWRVEVQDQGPGILPGEREHLFVEYASISSKPTGGEPSTGLGLSIVKSLAEAQEGRVGADFPDSGGSVFWLELPASRPGAG